MWHCKAGAVFLAMLAVAACDGGTTEPGAMTRISLVFATLPPDMTAGEPQRAPLIVRALDQHGVIAGDFDGPVSLALGHNPGAAALAGTTTVAAAGGVATFSDYSIDATGTGYTFVATSPGLAETVSWPFEVRAPDPCRLVTPHPWKLLAPPPEPRDRGVLVAAGGLVYLIGGLNVDGPSNPRPAAVQAYGPATNTWTTKAPIPTARFAHVAATVDGIIYVVGGFGDDPAAPTPTEAYDPATNTWTARAPPPVKRIGASAGVVNGRLYVAGGNIRPATRVDVYDPAADSWLPRAPLPTDHHNAGAGVIGGIFHVVGNSDFLPPRDRMYAYDPAMDAWTTEATMPRERFQFSAAVVGNELYAIGGASLPDQNGDGIYETAVDVYDASTRTWRPGPAVPGPGALNTAVAAGCVIYLMDGTRFLALTP
jgi:N-acetylneuraminic acid mutarotase